MNVSEYYEHALAERGYKPDSAQKKAIDRLQRYYDDWVKFKSMRSNALKKLLNRPDVPRGVYLWGGVGRGKSFLMYAFYATVPVVRKTRLHFHEFMRGVHRELEEVKGMQDPLDEVARRVAKRYRLICFDEFHVSDVADAMILHRLLLKLFEYGTSFVMTSNYEPSTLYPDGLHRDRVLPAIKLIQSRMDVMNVDAGVDYRRRSLEQVQCYHAAGRACPAGVAENLRCAGRHAAPGAAAAHRASRDPGAGARGFGRVVRLRHALRRPSFAERLPGTGQSASRGDPVGRAPDGAAPGFRARRFTWLIDVFYDHRVKLIMSAECEPKIYTGRAGQRNSTARSRAFLKCSRASTWNPSAA